MSFERKVIRNKLKKRQGNNKIRDIFHYVQVCRKIGDYKSVNKILEGR
jgi:hypothetical protein